MSEYTVHLTLLSMGLCSCRAGKVLMLTPVDHQKQLQWAHEHLKWTMEQQKKVVSSD